MFRLFKKKKPSKNQPQESETNTAEEQVLDAETDFLEQQLEHQSIEQPNQAEVQKKVQEEPQAEIQIETPEELPEEIQQEAAQQETSKPKKEGLFKRLRSGLSKTGSSITEGMGDLVLGKKKIDEDVLEDLETRLLMADVGMEATTRIINDLTKRVSRDELNDGDALTEAMYTEMVKILRPVAKPLDVDDISPAVILLVGINGAGKTTTIGKLAKKFQSEGKSVMLAAGDTFRAAAVEQLQVWGERNDIPVIAQGTGADSASVIYDAMESAKAKNIDVLLADTAGRLHTQTNLMEELKKVKRVMQKIEPNAPHEVMLIVDASIGQNALAQATEFDKALGLTGITVTKLDGTAKGGILFAIAEKTGIPVRFIGVGESIDDLQEFDAYEFAGALLAGDDE
ncbi:MAG: signal recognition particle-docking protein FtsY [Cocleimonas sp.]|nr:signal recognition particle-docking protein FtsY [Cocleimonas sp.]